MNNIDLVIMAGGEGTRLHPFTKIVPKVLLYVDGKSMLEHTIDFFRGQGIGKVYLLTKYKSDLVRAYIDYVGIDDIEIVEEETPMGTAGGLSLIGDRLSSRFFVSNCDMMVDVDLKELVDGHTQDGINMSIVSFNKPVSVPYGIFEFDDEGEIIDFLEKPTIQLWANAGVYLMDHSVFEYIKPGRMNMDELFHAMLNSGSNVRVVPIGENSFKDIGEFQYYKKVLEEMR